MRELFYVPLAKEDSMADAAFELETATWKYIPGGPNDAFFARSSFFSRRSDTIKIRRTYEVFPYGDCHTTLPSRNWTYRWKPDRGVVGSRAGTLADSRLPNSRRRAVTCH